MTSRALLRSGLRAVALFEASKGAIVLLAGSGLLLLVHRDVQAIAERLVAHLHLDPASHYPRVFLHLVGGATPARIRLLAAGALLYATIRFLEAGGLWYDRKWAEWLGVVTAAIYLPLEVLSFVRHPRWGALAAMALNALVIAMLVRRLQQRSRIPSALE